MPTCCAKSSGTALTATASLIIRSDSHVGNRDPTNIGVQHVGQRADTETPIATIAYGADTKAVAA